MKNKIRPRQVCLTLSETETSTILNCLERFYLNNQALVAEPGAYKAATLYYKGLIDKIKNQTGLESESL